MIYTPKFIFLLTLIIGCIVITSARGQSNINFTSMTVKEGLPSNSVNNIIEDKYGLIWFGTSNGLARFDGSNYRIYRHEANNPFSLPGNDVQAIYQDKKGTIWVNTNVGGIYYYDRSNDRFICYIGDGSWPVIRRITVRCFMEDHNGILWVATYGSLRKIDPKSGRITKVNIYCPPSELATFVVLSVFEDSVHKIWIGTNIGLYLIDPKLNKVQRFTHNQNDNTSLSNDIIKKISEDSKGNIWFATYGGLNEWLSSGHFRSFRHDERSKLTISNDGIYAISPDKNGTLWIGTEDGVNIYDPKTESFIKVGDDERNPYKLCGRSIRSLLIDSRGIYWIGTYGAGISKYDRNLALFNVKRGNPFDSYGLKSPMVTSFAAVYGQKIFVGTDGAGIELFDRGTGLFNQFKMISKVMPTKKGLTITTLYVDRKGFLWAGTYNDGLFRIEPGTGRYIQFLANEKGLSLNKISALTEDNNGNIWIGTIGKGVDIYNPNTGTFRTINNQNITTDPAMRLPSNGFTNSMICAPNGDVWIGSTGTGIAVYHPADGKFTHFTRANSNLADDVVPCMYIAKNGVLWVGTNQGISYFNKKTGKFVSYNETNGLANAYVKTILEDSDGLLWISTDKGVSSFDSDKKKFRNFTEANGALQSSFITSSGMKAANGELYFGGQDGFIFFDPLHVPVETRPGAVFFTELKINNEPITPGVNAPIKEQIGITKEIRLHYGQSFSLSYVALDYTSPEQNQYAYKLLNFDKDWNYVHSTRTANYTNIDPGTYVFMVKSTTDNNHWSGSRTQIRIVILPPFWRTWYAYLAYALFIIAILLSIRRRGIQKLKAEYEMDREKMQIRQLIEQERLETERLRELDDLKIKFLTDLSHEFRTPISLIAAPVEKLLEKKVADEDIADLRMISRNVRRLLNLVNQLLDFRKMEEKGLVLNLIPGNILGFINEAAEAFREIGVKKQINLHIENGLSDHQFLFDSDKVERIVFNLLSNAFKFTPPGGEVFLQTAIVDENSHQARFVLKVTDTGPGIPHQDLDKIFERFYQSEQPDSIINKGTGIGLSITKDFVNLHGGSIYAEGTPDRGTKFIVEIPLTIVRSTGSIVKNKKEKFDHSADDLSEVNVPAINRTANKPPMILLVEDNEEFRLYLIDHLKQFYNIVGACDGKEGWQKTLSIHPELVVSDIAMPQMNGIDLCKKIKGDKRTSHIPIILLTASNGEKEQLKGFKSGANDYLTKPFSFNILDARIASLLSLNRTLKDTYSKHIQLVNKPLETESAELKLLNKVMKYVEEKLSDCDLSVEELSKYVGMSRATLYYKMIELTGLPPTEYIRMIKLDKAAALLETSDLNVSQIAYMTGFATPSYFSKMFKSKFGMSPSEYLNLKKPNKKAK